MSLEQTAYVTRGNVPTPDALQAAVDALGFDCKIDRFVPFESSGFLPCLLGGRESGFEIYFDDAAEVSQPFPDLPEQLAGRDVAVTFRFGGDMAECACVLIASAALAKWCGAIVHYHDDDMLLSEEQLLAEAQAALDSLE